MFRNSVISLGFFTVFSFISINSWAMVDGAISGSVQSDQEIAVPEVPVQLESHGKTIRTTNTSATGDFDFFPIEFGDYQISVQASGFIPYRSSVHVASGSTTRVNIQLKPMTASEVQSQPQEMVLEVKTKRKLIQTSTSTSSTQTQKEDIAKLPQGGEITLPRLLATTNPGVVQGPFGQTFFRGNHANIQYQIDGVQMPDSPSNTFGQAFSPRNIDHMEVITGGIPAEYGQRLAAVVNIVSKSGTETPGGEVELNYGSYNAISPHLLYGGSNETGNLHYFFSANYNRTDRGLDTPQPLSTTNQMQGGTDAIHDQAYGNNEFAKMDWQMDNNNKLSLVLFNAENTFQIPNYPCSFNYNDPFFQAKFTDQFGNGGDPGSTTFNYVPCGTNDSQSEANAYAQLIWKRTLTDHSFLQVAPYYKYSAINVGNDPINDLATSATGATPITGSSPSSFSENRHVNNVGLKVDYSLRPNDQNLVKAGMQIQAARAEGPISIQTSLTTPPVIDNSPTNAYFGSLYVQDDWNISKLLTLNAGLRYDATQFIFSGATPFDNLFQPRIGLSYMLTDTTKLHAFYGKLFQPAPAENLRDSFVATGISQTNCPAGQLCPYDIKAEKDDYYEVGIAQQIGDKQVALLNVYYKNATDMLDDAQLLNTSIAQPFNFAHGYAYGIEVSLKGQLNEDWSDYANYSYEIAKGQGISGGIFAVGTGSSDYQFLDHVQIHTANAGLTYSKNNFWWTTQGLFGSGLRTGLNNSISLPAHFTADTTVGYTFKGDSWLTRFKVSGDVINIFNNVYPITVANGYNGSHYAAGRLYYLRLTKEL